MFDNLNVESETAVSVESNIENLEVFPQNQSKLNIYEDGNVKNKACDIPPIFLNMNTGKKHSNEQNNYNNEYLILENDQKNLIYFSHSIFDQ